MTTRIEVDHLTLRYGKAKAIDDLSFCLEGNKIYGLLGRNGSGKTTLLSVLSGFRKASDGDVRIDGQSVFESEDIVRRICFIRGGGDTVEHCFPEDRVSNALEFAAVLRPNWDAGLAAELVARFDLPLRSRLDRLSRGQRSAVGIVLGLASRAPLTIFDESHLGLDAPSRATFYDVLLSEHLSHSRSFVISSHLIDEIASLLQEVVMIDGGKLLLQEEAEKLRDHGTTVTGKAELVDRFVEGRSVLAEKQLGPTKQAAIVGGLDEQDRNEARSAGLDLSPIALQELFVHLTSGRVRDEH